MKWMLRKSSQSLHLLTHESYSKWAAIDIKPLSSLDSPTATLVDSPIIANHKIVSINVNKILGQEYRIVYKLMVFQVVRDSHRLYRTWWDEFRDKVATRDIVKLYYLISLIYLYLKDYTYGTSISWLLRALFCNIRMAAAHAFRVKQGNVSVWWITTNFKWSNIPVMNVLLILADIHMSRETNQLAFAEKISLLKTIH